MGNQKPSHRPATLAIGVALLVWVGPYLALRFSSMSVVMFKGPAGALSHPATTRHPAIFVQRRAILISETGLAPAALPLRIIYWPLLRIDSVVTGTEIEIL